MTHSFPTRRSSDLPTMAEHTNLCLYICCDDDPVASADRNACVHKQGNVLVVHPPSLSQSRKYLVRSEEHTSDLQSLMRISYAVFCLKKNTITIMTFSTSCTPITP